MIQLSHAGLVDGYSQKAVNVKGLRPDEALYRPGSESMTDSAVFAPDRVDTAQAPVGFRALGEGWVGYVGDINGEEGSDGVVLAMCGL